MKIHEYQARKLFEEYGIPTPKGLMVDSPHKARRAAETLGRPVVVKAQVLVGGRGKAGGVKLARNPEEAERAAEQILGMKIKDIIVERVYVACSMDIQQELYVGLTVDRSTGSIALMASAEGGVDIEELAATRPEAVATISLPPLEELAEGPIRKELRRVFGAPDARAAADGASDLEDQAWDIVRRMHRLFVEKDCSLLEINPLALVPGGTLMALDAKINFDDSALYKHPDILSMRNPEEYSADEIHAREVGLSFVSLDGDIGCIVNGAGLAMATMDIIQLFGGKPANFLDVGGSSSPAKVLNALQIILGNPRVRAILINIFGGITRCDDIAKGIVMARKQLGITLPMVIRLVGTNEKEGRDILKGDGLQAATDMTEAVRKVLGS